MTEPLCDEPDAEQICEANLKEALQIQPDNMDALMCLAKIRMMRAKDKEAKSLFKKLVQKMDILYEQQKKAMSVGTLIQAKKD